MRMHDVRWMLLLAAVLGACTCDGPVASGAHEVVAPAATDVPCFYPEGARRCAVPGPSCRGARVDEYLPTPPDYTGPPSPTDPMGVRAPRSTSA